MGSFALFIAFWFLVGGNALNGFVSKGHYFVRSSGVYTEVSYAVYAYSIVHTLSLFVTHPLAVLVMMRGRRRLRDSILR